MNKIEFLFQGDSRNAEWGTEHKRTLTELSQILGEETRNWKMNSLLRFPASQHTERAENSAMDLVRDPEYLFSFLVHL